MAPKLIDREPRGSILMRAEAPEDEGHRKESTSFPKVVSPEISHLGHYSIQGTGSINSSEIGLVK